MDNYNGFSLVGNPDQEKYKNNKSSIQYEKFTFNYYVINDLKSKKK